MTEPVKYMTVQEVADTFRRSKRTILRWIEEKNPIENFTRVRDGILVPRAEVDRILEEGRNADIADLAVTPAPKPRKKSRYVQGWRK